MKILELLTWLIGLFLSLMIFKGIAQQSDLARVSRQKAEYYQPINKVSINKNEK